MTLAKDEVLIQIKRETRTRLKAFCSSVNWTYDKYVNKTLNMLMLDEHNRN